MQTRMMNTMHSNTNKRKIQKCSFYITSCNTFTTHIFSQHHAHTYKHTYKYNPPKLTNIKPFKFKYYFQKIPSCMRRQPYLFGLVVFSKVTQYFILNDVFTLGKYDLEHCYPTDKLMSHQLQMQNIYLCLHSKLKMKLVIEPIIIRIAKQSEEEEKDPTTTF